MQNSVPYSNESKNHVWLPINKYKAKIPVEKIIRLEALSNYTKFYINGQEKLIIVAKTIKHYHEKLNGQQFVRPHQSHLVNKSYIETYSTKNGGFLILKDETKIGISRRKKKATLNCLSLS